MVGKLQEIEAKHIYQNIDLSKEDIDWLINKVHELKNNYKVTGQLLNQCQIDKDYFENHHHIALTEELEMVKKNRTIQERKDFKRIKELENKLNRLQEYFDTRGEEILKLRKRIEEMEVKHHG